MKILKEAVSLLNLAFNSDNTNQKKHLKDVQSGTDKNISYFIIPDKLYTVSEAAQLLRVEKCTIYKWHSCKKIKASKSGGKLLFLGATLKKFLNL
jgi:excisionase family DNA binding protein